MQTPAGDEDKRVDYLMRSSFAHYHQENLVKLVTYVEVFNQGDIYEAPKYTVSCIVSIW